MGTGELYWVLGGSVLTYSLHFDTLSVMSVTFMITVRSDIDPYGSEWYFLSGRVAKGGERI